MGVGSPPLEFITYRLCEKFGKLPSEIKGEDMLEILTAITCAEQEAKAQDFARRKAEMKQKAATKRGR